MRRTRKNSTGNSTDSESSDESLENLTIRDEVAEVNTMKLFDSRWRIHEVVEEYEESMKNNLFRIFPHHSKDSKVERNQNWISPMKMKRMMRYDCCTIWYTKKITNATLSKRLQYLLLPLQVDVIGDVVDSGDETEREEEDEDGSDLSEGEIDYESDVESDEEIRVD